MFSIISGIIVFFGVFFIALFWSFPPAFGILIRLIPAVLLAMYLQPDDATLSWGKMTFVVYGLYLIITKAFLPEMRKEEEEERAKAEKSLQKKD